MILGSVDINGMCRIFEEILMHFKAKEEVILSYCDRRQRRKAQNLPKIRSVSFMSTDPNIQAAIQAPVSAVRCARKGVEQ